MVSSRALSLVTATAFALTACSNGGMADTSPAARGEPSPALSADPAASSAEPDEGTSGYDGATTYRLVTLGDLYTYGTGTDAPRRDSWPQQVATAITQRSGMRIFLRNLAGEESVVSEDVLLDQVGQVAAQEPDVVTLQVGVNDIVGHQYESYGQNIGAILDELLKIVSHDRIFVITTPDHTLTEWGKARGTSEAVAALNSSLYEEAAARDIEVIDIGPVNQRVTRDPSLLVQSDPPEPYPTAKQYAGWAEAIGPYIYDALLGTEP